MSAIIIFLQTAFLKTFSMKPFLKITLLFGLLVSGGLLFTLNSCGDDEVTDPVLFGFSDNLAIVYGQEAPITIDLFSEDIATLELIINDSVINTWDKPSGKLSYTIASSGFGIGAKSLSLKSRLNDGTVYEDRRMLRVLSDLVPERWTYTVADHFPHNVANFTQGLEFDEGTLYESTGQNGASKVAKIDLSTGADIAKIELDATHFGEGMTIMGDTLYQITWQSGRCFLYDKNTLTPLSGEFSYKGEGWGLCHDDRYLIMSDGTERITFRDPRTFSIVRTIEVYTNEGPVTSLNELEYIDGLIYANIWMTNNIAIIEPETGRVLGVMDGSPLVAQGRGNIGEAFNGIAYNPLDQHLYLTGKRWQRIFKVTLNKPVS